MFLFESFVFISITFYFWFISDQWKFIQIPNLLFAATGTVILYFMPESPRFLVSMKRFDEAREVFKMIGKINGLTEEQLEAVDEFKFDAELESNKSQSNHQGST